MQTRTRSFPVVVATAIVLAAAASWMGSGFAGNQAASPEGLLPSGPLGTLASTCASTVTSDGWGHAAAPASFASTGETVTFTTPCVISIPAGGVFTLSGATVTSNKLMLQGTSPGASRTVAIQGSTATASGNAGLDIELAGIDHLTLAGDTFTYPLSVWARVLPRSAGDADNGWIQVVHTHITSSSSHEDGVVLASSDGSGRANFVSLAVDAPADAPVILLAGSCYQLAVTGAPASICTEQAPVIPLPPS